MTLLEIMIAATLLGVVMLALISGSASTQRASIEAREIVMARNFAHDTMEQLLLVNWTKLREYAVNTINGQRIEFDVPGLPAQATGSKYCTVIVREPTIAEAPAYFNFTDAGVAATTVGSGANASHRRGPNGPPSGPVAGSVPLPNAPPATGPSGTVEAPGAGGPTMFTIIVQVTIPNAPGIKGGASVRLQCLRSSL